VWIAWANGSLHHELHGHEDARARSTFLLQILVLAAMGAFIPQAGGARGAAFAVAAAVLFAVLAILTLTGVVAGLSAEPVSGLSLAVGLVAVVVGFGAWWTYFDFAGGRHPRTQPAATLQWILGHLPLTAAVAVMGAAMVSLVDHAHDGRTPAATAWLLCAGTAVVLGATMRPPTLILAGDDDPIIPLIKRADHAPADTAQPAAHLPRRPPRAGR